jgi:RpiB/LacA/LacB family sugar-phosphate isomerase
MVIGLGCDHRGFRLKEALRKHLAEREASVHDFGTNSEQPVDYPIIALRLAVAVSRCEAARGILVCGTGLGMAIAANKVPGIQAATVHDVHTARLARERNDAHIIAIGADVVKNEENAVRIVAAFLDARFQGGPSVAKIARIAAIEHRFRGGRSTGGHPWTRP